MYDCVQYTWNAETALKHWRDGVSSEEVGLQQPLHCSHLPARKEEGVKLGPTWFVAGYLPFVHELAISSRKGSSITTIRIMMIITTTIIYSRA